MKLKLPGAASAARIIVGLMFLLLPCLGLAKVQAPITTSLDVLKMPAAGGQGTVLWTGVPEVTAQSAEIVFLLTAPGAAAPARTSQALTLSAGRVADASFTFATPAAGAYTIVAAIHMTAAGGQFSQTSQLRLEVPASGPALLASEPKLTAKDFQLRSKPAEPPVAVASPLSLNTAAFRISGTLKYTDRLYGNSSDYTGTAPTPIRRALVEIRDRQSSGYRTLGTTRTDETGSFFYDISSNKDTDGTGLDVYLHVSTDSAEAKVTDLAGNTYFYESATQTNWPGGALALGTITVAQADSGPWNIFDTLVRGYDFARAQGVAASQIPQVQAQWAVGNLDGTYYDPNIRTIMLLGGSSDSDDFDDPVIMHEYGHFMEDTLGYSKNPGGSHSWTSRVSPALAWSEGWATFFSSAVRNSQYYFDWMAGGAMVIDLEQPTDNPLSDWVEGAVAGSLWDIFDSHNDGADLLSDGMTHIWYVFHHYFNITRNCVMQDFYNGWVAYQFPSLPAVQAILSDHGIAYGWDTTPQVNSFTINGGAASTLNRVVTLNNTAVFSPAYYMASESSAFTGAAWLAYSAAPIYSIASAGNGLKTVYFRVKNAAGQVSYTASASIQLSEPPAPKLTQFSINNGAASTPSQTVTLNNTCSLSPAYYMASQNVNFSGAGWVAYSAAPTFQLSAGDGVKTVYLKVKNTTNQVSAVLSDTITLATPQPKVQLASLSINSGAASTASRTVTLNNTYTGTEKPSGYQVSEDPNFIGAAWQTWSAAPVFWINSAGNGTKTVYFRIKDSVGMISAVKIAAITLAETTSIAIGATLTGNIETTQDYDLFQFKVTAAGWYTISTTAGTLSDGFLHLYDGTGKELANADNQGANLMPMLSLNLAAGTYSARVEGENKALGTYTLTVKTGSAYQALTSNGSAIQGTILGGNQVNWFQFTIAKTGSYTLSTTAGTLTDAKMFLYLAGASASLAVNDDAVSYSSSTKKFSYPMMPLISTTLKAGTYNVAVMGYSAQDLGTYTIKLASGSTGASSLTLIPNWPGTPGNITSSASHNLFLFTVDARNSYTLDAAAGGLVDGQMTLYKMTLSSSQTTYDLAVVDYNDDRGGSNLMPLLKETLDPGTYLVDFSAVQGSGSFTLSLTQP